MLLCTNVFWLAKLFLSKCLHVNQKRAKRRHLEYLENRENELQSSRAAEFGIMLILNNKRASARDSNWGEGGAGA